MNIKRKLVSLALSMVLLLGLVQSVSAATYIAGNLSNNVGKNANGSLTWSQASGTAGAKTVASSGCWTTTKITCTLISKLGTANTTKSGSGSGYTSSSASCGNSTVYVGFTSMYGTHTATYSNGSWYGGTNW